MSDSFNGGENEAYVSFEIAQLLKEAGFDWKTVNWYHHRSGEMVFSTYNSASNYNNLVDYGHAYESAPTLAVAQKWLLEKHQMLVTVYSISQESWHYHITKPHENFNDGEYGEDYYSYDDALAGGILQCLKLILNGKVYEKQL